MKLRTKILSYTLPLILIPFLLTALAVYYFIIRANQIEVLDENKLNLNEALGSISADIESVKKDVILLSKVPSITEYLSRHSNEQDVAERGAKSAKTVLELFFEQNPYYLRLSLVDKKGNEVVVLSKFTKKTAVKKPVSDERYFRRALITSFVQSPIREVQEGKYATIFAQSVVTKKFLGMIVLTLDARIFERSLRPLLEHDLSAFLFDDRGLILASAFNSDEDRSLAGSINLKREASELLSQSTFVFKRSEVSNESKTVLFSVLPSESFSRAGDFETPAGANWLLGVFEPQNTLAIPRMLQVLFFSILFLTIAAVLFIAAIASRRITVPLEKLSRATDKIARGESDFELDIQTGDEVEDLASAVIKMNSELKEYQKQIIHSAKLAAMGEMTSEISHEIQNRISGISLWLQHLDSEIADGDPKQEYLDEMKLGLSGFMEMLSSLKGYYKTPVLNLGDVDLNRLVNDSLLFVEEKTHEKKVNVLLEFSDSLPRVKGDEEKLKSVILNLLLNAIDSLGKDGKIEIETEFVRQRGNVVLKISDNGSGISEDNLSRVFYPFYSTKPGGSGLGLAISSNIIAAHSGRIEVESEVGKGTTFKIVLKV